MRVIVRPSHTWSLHETHDPTGSERRGADPRMHLKRLNGCDLSIAESQSEPDSYADVISLGSQVGTATEAIDKRQSSRAVIDQSLYVLLYRQHRHDHLAF
jgi:hypothetical protein